MIKHILTIVALLTAIGADAQTLKITNPTTLQRTDELVLVKRNFIENKVGKLQADQHIGISKKDGSPIFVQFDDLDKDGAWDELAFLYSFAPKEKTFFTLSTENLPLIKPVQRAHVRQMRKNANDTFGPQLLTDSVPAGQPNTDFSKVKLPDILTEGPAWENDKVGFREYMDVRNIKDIWGKTTSKMMMDEVGVDPTNIYHHKAAWGMDILAVGKSLGAGSLAILVPKENGNDTLIRLGGKNMGPIYYEQLADGPVRAVFIMHFPQWQALPGLPAINLTEKVSIWGGQYFYQSEVSAVNLPEKAKLVSGIVNLKSEKANKIASKNSKALYTFAKQSENGDNLGLAIITKKDKDIGITETAKTGEDDILSTYILSVPFKNEHQAVFRFYAGWEASDGMFTSETGFTSFLNKQLTIFSYPLKIK
ncbi:DUF4861 family protein [Pelobium manganitolerans]|uniref:DUF4861 family protein n=1 Tax=Pelobium manganitolerans TaxID=1842495 RepID=UPI003FA3D9F1